jgi:hypothetical protein
MMPPWRFARAAFSVIITDVMGTHVPAPVVMKTALLLVACCALNACVTARKSSPARVLRESDPVLGRVLDVTRFEGRLDELGAKIEQGTTSDERIATVALPGKPGYFPPRTLRVIYVISDRGMVELKSAEVTVLGSRFARHASGALGHDTAPAE